MVVNLNFSKPLDISPDLDLDLLMIEINNRTIGEQLLPLDEEFYIL